jgi:hypothetical protein
VLGGTEGEDDARGESGGGRDYECRADAPRTAAARHIEHGRRGRLERSLTELRGGGPNAPGPRGAVRADPKVRLKSAAVEFLQLAIEIGGD